LQNPQTSRQSGYRARCVSVESASRFIFSLSMIFMIFLENRRRLFPDHAPAVAACRLPFLRRFC
jgi:hypothetical protein